MSVQTETIFLGKRGHPGVKGETGERGLPGVRGFPGLKGKLVSLCSLNK